MTLKESYEIGRDRMYYMGLTLELELDGIETLEELEEKFKSDLHETEQNDRSYAPFEFTARDLNESPDPEAAWAEFEKGLEVGANKAWRQRKAELAMEAGIEAPERKRRAPNM